MSKAALILALVALLPLGCKQRQHISKQNINVVQLALAQAQAANAQVLHLTRNIAGKAAPTASPRLAMAARVGSTDAVVTAKEVESVLGPPHEVDPPETALRDVEVFRYYYYQDADRYEFHFHNGQLLEINLLPPHSDKKS